MVYRESIRISVIHEGWMCIALKRGCFYYFINSPREYCVTILRARIEMWEMQVYTRVCMYDMYVLPTYIYAHTSPCIMCTLPVCIHDNNVVQCISTAIIIIFRFFPGRSVLEGFRSGRIMISVQMAVLKWDLSNIYY